MSQAPANLPTRWSTMWECTPDVMVHIGDRSFGQYVPTSDQQKQKNNAFKTNPVKGPRVRLMSLNHIATLSFKPNWMMQSLNWEN